MTLIRFRHKILSGHRHAHKTLLRQVAICFGICATSLTYFNLYWLRLPSNQARGNDKDLMAMPSSSRRLSSHRIENQDTRISQDECFVAGRGMTKYRYPTLTFSAESIRQKDDSSALVVGVLSYRSEERKKVRQNWASGHSNVFFLVSGNWTMELEREFRAFNDILYIEAPEGYREITAKVLVFLSAVHKYLPDATILKTDDDSYVRMAEMHRIANERKGTPFYIGAGCDRNATVVRRLTSDWYVSRDVYPHDHFPNYAFGGGYLLSPDANTCAVQQMQKRINDTQVFPVEDAFLGILLSGCPKVECETELRFRTSSKSPIPPKLPTGITKNYIEHQVKDDETMFQMHLEACCNTKNKRRLKDPVSCGAISCPPGFMAMRQQRISEESKHAVS